MRRKRFWLVAGLVIVGMLAIVTVPVLIHQLQPTTGRRLEGVKLDEVSYREVQFRNDAHNINLAGMLLVPEGDGPFPAVVIIHGSGTSQRDNGWYLTLSKHLQQNGIVVLLPDKRGSERSQGNWRQSSFPDLAGDTQAGIDLLQSQQEIPISKIGVVGMSQGGKIAPIVASQSPEVAFVVNMVGGAAPLESELAYEEDYNLQQMGFLPGISKGIAFLSTSYLVNVSQKEFWSHVGNFDPLPYWQQVSVPVLALYGEIDTNVDAKRSAARLESLAKPNIQVAILNGSGHALEDPEGQGNSIIRRDVLERISTFIHDNARADARPATQP